MHQRYLTQRRRGNDSEEKLADLVHLVHWDQAAPSSTPGSLLPTFALRLIPLLLFSVLPTLPVPQLIFSKSLQVSDEKEEVEEEGEEGGKNMGGLRSLLIVTTFPVMK